MAAVGRVNSILILVLAVLAAAAPAMESTLSDDCSGTLSRAPQDCVQELGRAISSGSTAGSFGPFQVSPGCCLLLACVREPSCAPALHNYCPPPGEPCP